MFAGGGQATLLKTFMSLGSVTVEDVSKLLFISKEKEKKKQKKKKKILKIEREERTVSLMLI